MNLRTTSRIYENYKLKQTELKLDEIKSELFRLIECIEYEENNKEEISIVEIKNQIKEIINFASIKE